jgi:hypothetical protein
MSRVNLEFMIPDVVRAVVDLTSNDCNRHTSYAFIARKLKDNTDTHGRDAHYNRVVKAVKLAVSTGKLRYLITPIAGHPALIALPEVTQCQ